MIPVELEVDSSQIGIGGDGIEPEPYVIPIEIEVDNPEISLEISDYVGSGGGSQPPDYYDGEYDVIPKVEPQSLATKGKTMKRDVEVAEIPLHEFSNASGGTTVVIGGVL